jgi:inner membrane protein involved in colicin E2 resistance
MFFIVSGVYLTMPILAVWTAINQREDYKRSVALGIITSFGNAGALVAPAVFLDREAPVYKTGMRHRFPEIVCS